VYRYGKKPSELGEKGESVATAFFLFADGKIWRRGRTRSRRLRRFPIILIGRLRLWGMVKVGVGAMLVLAKDRL
jgi:hypothetical protein